jgi:solute carrier family 25 carnitine/acylcarnitine transporter 20/29
MNPVSQNSLTLTQKFTVAATSGAIGGVLGLLLEHPFDTIKTRQQAEPRRGASQIATEIFASDGVRGFYSGFVPNSVRVAFKQFYRWPAMLLLPSYFRENLPDTWQARYPSIVKISTGCSIAIFESGFANFSERLKVYLMTANVRDRSIRHFLHQTQENRFGEFFRGFNAMLPKGLVSWVTYLVVEEKLKNRERAKTGAQELSYASLMKVSVFVGVVNTLAVMPFDIVKTALQKSDYIENAGVIKTMRSIQRQHGVLALYSGWQAKMVQYMINASITVSLLDSLENRFRKLSLQD